MKIKRNEKCNCGSGLKYKHCCLRSNSKKPKNDDIDHFEEVSVFYGFTKKHADTNPFEIDFENPDCLVIKANEEAVEHYNTHFNFNVLSVGEWFVIGNKEGQTKSSFRFDTADEAMEVAKEKFDVVRFLSLPEFI